MSAYEHVAVFVSIIFGQPVSDISNRVTRIEADLSVSAAALENMPANDAQQLVLTRLVAQMERLDQRWTRLSESPLDSINSSEGPQEIIAYSFVKLPTVRWLNSTKPLPITSVPPASHQFRPVRSPCIALMAKIMVA